MGPVLREIKEVFDRYKRLNFDDNGNHKDGIEKVCQRSPFTEGWMYHYLFPEIISVSFGKFFRRKGYYHYPCRVCSEEQVLRIMAECGLL